MARVLVTGAGGFIGAALVTAHVEKGDDVVAFVHSKEHTKRLVTVQDRITIVEVDSADKDGITNAAAEASPTIVYHMAAANIASGALAPADEVVRTNVLGTQYLLSALEGTNVEACVLMGTFLEYGPKDHPVQESDACEPPELYSVTKLAGTLLGQAAARRTGLPVLTFRLFTPYGPGMQEGRLVRTALTKALKNEAISLTSPQVSRDFIYIEDVVALLMEGAARAKEYKGEVFNLGSGTKTTLEEFAGVVKEAANSISEVSWGSYQSVSYDSETWQADMSKTLASFAWRPKVLLSEGIRRTAAWLTTSP